VTGLVTAERGIGEVTLVDALPELVVVAFAAVTHPRGPVVPVRAAGGRLLVRERSACGGVAAPRRATAIAAVTCAYAATALGKAWFALPRPPGAIGPADVPAWLPSLLSAWYEAQVLSDGFGFPSGHATGGAAAYLALALVYDRAWTGQRRLLAAVLVAVAVAASRVVIEVHYLVDVLAGLAVGGGSCSVRCGSRATRGFGEAVLESEGGFDSRGATAALDPTLPFLLAAVVSTGALAVTVAGGHTGEVVEAGIGIATGAGGAVGWRLVDDDEPAVPVRIAVPALAVTGGLWVGAYVFAGSVAVTLAATTAAVVAVVALPALPERIERMSGAWN